MTETQQQYTECYDEVITSSVSPCRACAVGLKSFLSLFVGKNFFFFFLLPLEYVIVNLSGKKVAQWLLFCCSRAIERGKRLIKFLTVMHLGRAFGREYAQDRCLEE